jgi:ribosomal protein S26
LTGNTPLFLIATSFALGAAFLNAAFGFCLGCQMYLGFVRLRSRLVRS